jgi:hypothetical protein
LTPRAVLATVSHHSATGATCPATAQFRPGWRAQSISNGATNSSYPTAWCTRLDQSSANRVSSRGTCEDAGQPSSSVLCYPNIPSRASPTSLTRNEKKGRPRESRPYHFVALHCFRPSLGIPTTLSILKKPAKKNVARRVVVATREVGR